MTSRGKGARAGRRAPRRSRWFGELVCRPGIRTLTSSCPYSCVVSLPGLVLRSGLQEKPVCLTRAAREGTGRGPMAGRGGTRAIEIFLEKGDTLDVRPFGREGGKSSLRSLVALRRRPHSFRFQLGSMGRRGDRSWLMLRVRPAARLGEVRERDGCFGTAVATAVEGALPGWHGVWRLYEIEYEIEAVSCSCRGVRC